MKNNGYNFNWSSTPNWHGSGCSAAIYNFHLLLLSITNYLISIQVALTVILKALRSNITELWSTISLCTVVYWNQKRLLSCLLFLKHLALGRAINNFWMTQGPGVVLKKLHGECIYKIRQNVLKWQDCMHVTFFQRNELPKKSKIQFTYQLC